MFADLKLHDIPNTVGRAARVLGRHGVDFLNFHAAGGETMLRAGVDGLARRRARRRTRASDRARGHGAHERPEHRRASSRATRRRVATRAATVSCARAATSRARARAALRTMVPGIRLAGDDANDQARVDTPGDAITRGADWLVIGAASRCRRPARPTEVRASDGVAERGLTAARHVAAGPLTPRGRPASCQDGNPLRILSRRRRPGGSRMPLPPALTPEQRQAALREGRRGAPSRARR